MRLTLRTLLAYLDGVLSHQDATKLEAKIEESDYAQQLIQRIRGITRQSRMESPRLDAKTPQGDPNVMAEYLDSTLDLDKVATFERVLLESDASLAEVASCHEILSKVLQQPTKVSSRLRRKLYRLESEPTTEREDLKPGQRIDAAHPSTPSDADEDEEAFIDAVRLPATRAPVLKPKASEGETKTRGKRSTSAGRKRRSTARRETVVPPLPEPQQDVEAVDLAAAELPSPTWVEQQGRRSPALPWIVTICSVVALIAVTILAATGTLQRWFSGGESTLTVNAENTLDAQDSNSIEPTQADSIASAADDPSSAPEDLRSVPPPNGDAVAGEAIDQRANPDQQSEPEVSTSEPPMDNDRRPAVVPRPDDNLDPLPQVAQIGKTALVAVRNNSGSPWAWATTETQPPVDVHNLEIFRSQWTWEGGPKITLVGCTELAFAGIDSGELSDGDSRQIGLRLYQGRLLIDADDKPGRSVLIQLGDRVVRCTLLEPDSRLAVERTAYVSPGVDRRQESRLWIDHIVGVRGRVNFEDASGLRTFEPQTGMTWHDGEQHQAGPLNSLAAWVESVDRLEEMSAEQLLRRIDPASAAIDDLQNLTNDDRPEVRVSATECLAELGRFEALYAALDSQRNRTNWRLRLLDLVDRQLVAHPDQARAWADFLGKQGEAGQLAFRMWTGFSEEQLADGEAEVLVNGLDHESLLIRSLAIRQLMRITGTSELYMPDAKPTRRARRVQAWRGRLGALAIYYAEPPAPPQLDYSTEP